MIYLSNMFIWFSHNFCNPVDISVSKAQARPKRQGTCWWKMMSMIFRGADGKAPNLCLFFCKSNQIGILVGGLVAIFYFPIYWESSSQLTFIFFRGVAQPPTSIAQEKLDFELQKSMAGIYKRKHIGFTKINAIKTNLDFDKILAGVCIAASVTSAVGAPKKFTLGPPKVQCSRQEKLAT